jgi:hypothetical protein
MPPRHEYDFAVNIRLAEHGDEFSWGFTLVDQDKKEQCRIEIKPDGTACRVKTGKTSKNLKLPDGFDATDLRQFGVLIKDGKMSIRLEDVTLGKFAAPSTETSFGIFAKNATVIIDMARLTVL